MVLSAICHLRHPSGGLSERIPLGMEGASIQLLMFISPRKMTFLKASPQRANESYGYGYDPAENLLARTRRHCPRSGRHPACRGTGRPARWSCADAGRNRNQPCWDLLHPDRVAGCPPLRQVGCLPMHLPQLALPGQWPLRAGTSFIPIREASSPRRLIIRPFCRWNSFPN